MSQVNEIGFTRTDSIRTNALFPDDVDAPSTTARSVVLAGATLMYKVTNQIYV